MKKFIFLIFTLSISSLISAGTTAINLAVQKGNLTEITKLISSGVDINIPDDNNITPLYLAAQNGQVELVKTLINAGADINPAKPPLLPALSNNNIEIVNILLKAGAKIDATDENGTTTLMAAAQANNIDFIKKLLSAGANINAVNNKGNSAAFYTNTVETLDFLKKNGADINASNKNGTTLLMLAVEKADPELLNYLVKNKININAKDNKNRTAFDYIKNSASPGFAWEIFKTGMDFEDKEKNLKNIFIGAIYTCDRKTVSEIINYRPKYKNYLISKWNSYHDLECQELPLLLLELGYEMPEDAKDAATPELFKEILKSKNKNKILKNKKLLNLFLINAVVNNMFTLIENEDSDLIDTIKIILEYGADPNVKFEEESLLNHISKSAMAFANMDKNHEQKQLMQALIKAGADINSQTNNNWTPLQSASFYSQTEIIDYLIKAGADINYNKNNGGSPLYLAKISDFDNKQDAVDLLIKAGAIEIEPTINTTKNTYDSREFDKLIVPEDYLLPDESPEFDEFIMPEPLEDSYQMPEVFD